MSFHIHCYDVCFSHTALELQPNDWLTMYYNGEVLGRQRKMKESKDMHTCS